MRHARFPIDRTDTMTTGQAWASRIDLYGHWHAGTFGNGQFNNRQILHEAYTVEFRVPRTVSHYDDLTVALAGGGAAFTQHMWSYELVTTNPEFTSVFVTFRQSNTGGGTRNITIRGVVPPLEAQGAIADPVNISFMPTGATSRSFYALGSTTNTHNIDTQGTHRIRTVAPEDAPPNLTMPAVRFNNSWSGQNPPDGVLMPLGGFNLDNSFPGTLHNQAMFVQVSDDPRIGVQAAILPAGIDGIVDLVATTCCGNILVIPPLTTITQPRTADAPFATISIDFRDYSLLPGQYIDSLFFEMAGGVPINSTFNERHNFDLVQAINPGIPFALFGRLPQGSIPVGSSITPAHQAWVGVRYHDPNDDYYGYTDLRAINADYMYTRQETLVSRGYGFNMGVGDVSSTVSPGNTSGGTLIAGEKRTVSFNITRHRNPLVLNTFGVQGFSIFLHSPVNVMTINMDSIRVSQDGVTWGNEPGDLPLPVPVWLTNPNHGNPSPVMRLDFPDIMLGTFVGREANGRFANSPPFNITFEVEAPMTARTGTVFGRISSV